METKEGDEHMNNERENRWRQKPDVNGTQRTTKEHYLKDTSWMMAASGHERKPGMYHCLDYAGQLYGLAMELDAGLFDA